MVLLHALFSKYRCFRRIFNVKTSCYAKGTKNLNYFSYCQVKHKTNKTTMKNKQNVFNKAKINELSRNFFHHAPDE